MKYVFFYFFVLLSVAIYADECCICLDPVSKKEAISVCNECDQQFHAECLERWRHRSAQCPLCRAKGCYMSSVNVVTNDEQIKNRAQIMGRSAYFSQDELNRIEGECAIQNIGCGAYTCMCCGFCCDECSAGCNVCACDGGGDCGDGDGALIGCVIGTLCCVVTGLVFAGFASYQAYKKTKQHNTKLKMTNSGIVY